MNLLICRPKPQAAELAKLLAQDGHQSVVWPSLEIVPRTIASDFAEKYQPEDLLIFISSNAVCHTAQQLSPALWQKICQSTRLFSMGPGTTKTLQNQGAKQVLTPEAGANTEALLAQPELQSVTQKTIWIFRGQGGRELLATTLRQRGAAVNYVESYARQTTQADLTPLLATWKNQPFDLVITTSSDGIKALMERLGPSHLPLLQSTSITAISQNMLTCAQALGLKQILLLDSANNLDMAKWLKRYNHDQSKKH